MKKFILVIFVCFLFISTFSTNAEVATSGRNIEHELLSLLPFNNFTKYSSLIIEPRIDNMLASCIFDKVDVKVRTSQPSRATFNIKCKTGKKIIFSAKSTGKIKILVARENILRKNRISTLNSYLKWINIDTIKRITINHLIQDNKYFATRNIYKNQPINLSNTKIIPDIEKNRIIKSISKNGLFYVSIRVKSLQSGNIGDFIEVKNTSSGVKFYAKVLNSSTVGI